MPKFIGRPNEPRELTQLQFMRRFTNAELAGIYTAAKQDADIEVFIKKVEAVKDTMSLDDPETVEGIRALEAGGLIAKGRADEILA